MSEPELSAGRLALLGDLEFDVRGERRRWPVLLQYPAETPYRPPVVTPLMHLPVGGNWIVAEVVAPANCKRMPAGYRRHQMPDFNLCIAESGSYSHEELITGIDVLRRAKEIFKAVELGRPFPFPDSEQAELSAHYTRIGDIILPTAFYSRTIAGRGRFFAYLHHDALYALPGFVLQEHPRELLVGVNLSTATPGGIETGFKDAADPAVARAFSWLATSRFTFEGMTDDEHIKDLARSGLWYDLPAEPSPATTGREIEDVLRDAGVGDTGAELERFWTGPEPSTLIGLRFPARGSDGLDWLVLRLRPGDESRSDDFQAAVHKDPHLAREVLRSAHVGSYAVHKLERARLEIRNGTLLPADLRDRRALLIGVGALGGEVAMLLAKAGVGGLILVDPESMRLENSIRHVSPVSAAGLAKVDAVRHAVWQYNPFVDVEVDPGSATSDLERLEKLLLGADVAVSTTADDNVEMVVNEAAVRVGRPVIYGRALRGGAVGRVFRVRPGVDACNNCLTLYRAKAAAAAGAQPAWVDIPEMEGEVIARECGRPVLASSAMDLQVVAGLTARAVVDYFAGADDWNTLIWSREPIQGADARLAQPFAIIRQRYLPATECRVCRTPQSRGIVLSPDAQHLIITEAEGKSTTETGGILIGYRGSDGLVHVEEATEAGPGSVETVNRFERDRDYCQARLEAASRRLGDKGQYVGEWHTHLEAKPDPSPRDVESLLGIAEAPNYLTNEPVMIIAGVDPNSGRVSTLNGVCFPMGMRAFPLDVSVSQVVSPPSAGGALSRLWSALGTAWTVLSRAVRRTS